MSYPSRGSRQFIGRERSLQRAWIKGAGFLDEELQCPLIGIVNTYQDFSPENVYVRTIADAVKGGGPIGLVEDGDRITLDLAARLLNLEVPCEILEQ